MKKAYPILLIILLGLLAWVYFHKDSGHSQEMQRLFNNEEVFKNQIDSLQSTYNELLRKKDSAAFQLFKRTQEAANRQEAEAVIWRQRFEKEKAKNRVFSEVQTDSLLSLVR